MGQNFLIDNHAIAEILGAIPEDAKAILEIGPGRGALTLPLARLGARILLLEKDEQVLAGTRTYLKIEGVENFTAWEGDALEFDFASIWNDGHAEGDIVVVSNLPYNIATEIMFRLLNFQSKISAMVLMFQEEVARRISASSGSKAYGAISVLVQNYYQVEHILKLSPESFRPRPRVESGVLKFVRRERPLLSIAEEKYGKFRDFVHFCFRHRRKTLLNSLSHNVAELPIRNRCGKTELASSLRRLGIDESRRAETLELEDFLKLFQLFSS